jgi:hypothetical protein
MPTLFRCQNCERERPRNYRLVEQKYCSDAECQKLRRREYQKQRRTQETGYARAQSACQKAWRKKSAALYQRSYREEHPDYVEQNRRQQRERNRKRRAHEPAPVIVKMSSCNAIAAGTYLLTPCEVQPAAMIVKMNSCLVQLALFQPVAPDAMGDA